MQFLDAEMHKAILLFWESNLQIHNQGMLNKYQNNEKGIFMEFGGYGHDIDNEFEFRIM